MRLKEIKPGMVIHCKTKEDLKKLSDIGISSCFGKRIDEYMKPACFVIIRDNNVADWTINIEEALEYGKITEFSDLIISDPELSAEEALLAYDQMCRENYCCNDCPIYEILGHECAKRMDGHITEIVDAIKKWKSDHEKKEPEIKTEWFWQGRIFKIEKDGGYYQIKDGNGFYDTGCKYRDDAEEYMEDKLKEHCKTNDGEFIAVVEHVCRVRAVE